MRRQRDDGVVVQPGERVAVYVGGERREYVSLKRWPIRLPVGDRAVECYLEHRVACGLLEPAGGPDTAGVR